MDTTQQGVAAASEWTAEIVLNRAIAKYYGLSLDISEDKLKKFIIPREAVLIIMEAMAAEIEERDSALATATQEREALRQVGWYGPYGIIPGGMDNEPAPNWLPVYVKTPAAPPQTDNTPSHEPTA